jgi:hypothetical protein
MKKRLTGIVLAVEIVTIVVLHSIKLSHQDKTKVYKSDEAGQQTSSSITYSQLK